MKIVVSLLIKMNYFPHTAVLLFSLTGIHVLYYEMYYWWIHVLQNIVGVVNYVNYYKNGVEPLTYILKFCIYIIWNTDIIKWWKKINIKIPKECLV